MSCFYGTFSHAATQYHRIIWDNDPATEAVIGFSPNGSSQNAYVTYGDSTNESTWQTKQVNQSDTFDGSLTSYFVRLSNLTANSAIYYRVCDQDGCGDRFWFKTAPNDNSPYVVVAGGDTRTGWTNRQMGNDLVAKLRPLFIMHGGDFTNANTASEMKGWLTDWARTFSDDVINGINYKRIYPLIPTHGNHEDDNYSTLCEVFGVDANQDSNCTPADTYNAFNISPLLRVYTLNSQFKDSGWSSYATAMNNWLLNDLANNGNSANWRFAQYHKPMFPHYTGKSENEILFDWWAQAFYDNAMNLVVESDTHMNKLTQALVPSGTNFNATTSGGTVYVGEGSWGAPARSANDPKSWTIDLASIQQFKVITVSDNGLSVRTAQFDTSAATLSRDERLADPTVLPANVNWWSANQVGDVMHLVQNNSGRSVIDNDGGNNGDLISLVPSDDVFIASSKADTNYNGSSDGLLADGSDSTYGEMQTLIKFDLSELPQCVETTEAKLELNVTNSSAGTYNIYFGNANWNEGSATWNNVGGDNQQGALITTVSPTTTGLLRVDLSDKAVLENWLTQGNYGLVIASSGTTDGIDMTSKESGTAPVLKVSFNEASDCGTPSVMELISGEGINELSASKGDSLLFFIELDDQTNTLSVNMSGGSGDADLYVKAGSEPTTSSYDCRPWKDGNNEVCELTDVNAGRYYIMLNGYDDFSDVTLLATVQSDSSGTGGSFSKESLSADSGEWLHYSIEIPNGMSSLNVNINGGSGDADLYVRQGDEPNTNNYDCRPWKNGNTESCSLPNPSTGTWYVSLHGYSAFSDVDLTANWNP